MLTSMFHFGITGNWPAKQEDSLFKGVQPGPIGRMRPRMTMNVAQRKIVNLLKTVWDFFLCVWLHVAMYLMWGPKQLFFFTVAQRHQKVGIHPGIHWFIQQIFLFIIKVTYFFLIMKIIVPFGDHDKRYQKCKRKNQFTFYSTVQWWTVNIIWHISFQVFSVYI